MSKYLESWQNALNQVAEWKPRPGMPGNTHQQMLKEVAPPAGVSGGGVKKDDHFEKVKKIKDQINKQKDKVAKFDLGDPKQKTPHALATADLKTMNLKLRDMQSAENEPETDDTGKPNKKKQIKEGDEEVLDEFTNFKSITFKPKGKYVSDGKYEIVYDYGRKALVTKKQLNVWLKQKFIEEAKAPFRLSYSDKYGKHAGFEDAKTLQDLQNKAQKLRAKGFKIDKMGRNTSPVEQKLPEPEGKQIATEDSGYLQSKMSPTQIANIKNVWKNKKATDVTDAVKQMIKRMDIPTQLAIKQADIPHLSLIHI